MQHMCHRGGNDCSFTIKLVMCFMQLDIHTWDCCGLSILCLLLAGCSRSEALLLGSCTGNAAVAGAAGSDAAVAVAADAAVVAAVAS